MKFTEYPIFNSLIIPILFLLSFISIIFSVIYIPVKCYNSCLSFWEFFFLIPVLICTLIARFQKTSICEYFKRDLYELKWKDHLWEGCILQIFRKIFSCLRKFSFSNIVSFYKYVSSDNYCEWRLRRHRAIDKYASAWLLASILFVIFCICYGSNTVFQNIVAVFAIYRLFEIFQLWVGDYILRNTGLENANRTLLLTFLTYIELIIWFAILAFINKESFCHIASMWDAWYYALSSGTMGSDIAPKEPIGYALFTTQIVFAVLFLTVVINRIIGIYKK